MFIQRIINFRSQISTKENKNNSILYQGSLRNRSLCQSVMNKKSALIFLTLLMLHCCKARWLLVETEDQNKEEDSTENNMLPDDLQLLDSSELNAPGARDYTVADWIFNVG